MSNPTPQRADYPHFQPITTRWHDNDAYGHVNNVTYYSYFDTAVNTYLIQVGGLDIHDGEVVGFVVSSACDYFASIAFPDLIEIGLRVGKLGEIAPALFPYADAAPVDMGDSFAKCILDVFGI